VYGDRRPPSDEPLHDVLRARLPAPARALIYGWGFLAGEYLSGRLVREMVGEAPGVTHMRDTTCMA
jgi:hypothetical protein